MEELPAANPETGAVDRSKIFKKPMHVAVITEDIKAISVLKKCGVKVNEIENGQTPLHLAVILRKTDTVRKLISVGANLSKMNKDGYTPLHLAVLNDSVSLIKDLIDRDAESDVDTFDRNGFTALHVAVVLGKVEAVRVLLEEGADCDLPNKEGSAPLHFALIQGYSDVIDVLLEYVDKPNILNKNEFRPLHLAVMYNQIDAIQKIGELDNLKVNYLNGDGDSALHIATKLGNLAAIEKLSQLGANMNLKNSKGYAPIHLAVIYSRLGAIETLVRCGARLDCADRLRNTAVHLAVQQENLCALQLLCRQRANLNLRNAYGNSPLLSAVMADCKRTTRLLLHFGASIDVLSAKGMTPLHIAVCLGNKDNIENLIRYGSSVHSLDAAGNRPLHSAAKLCNSAGIKYIIKYGARMCSMNRDGLTAVDIIMQYVRENAFKTAFKTLTELYKKRNLKRRLPLSENEILTSAKEIFRYEILKNFENSKLKNPEYLSNILPILKSYISDCFTEVKLMKSTLLHENFHFFSFVIFGWQHSMPLTREFTSEVVLDHILDVSTTKGYPCYRDGIVSKLERPALLKKALGLRIHARHRGKTIFVDSDAVPVIVQHLGNDDILNLLLAYSNSDPNVGISESSRVNKRKFAEHEVALCSVDKKSGAVCVPCGIRRAQLLEQQQSAKKSRSFLTNPSERVPSSIVTRSKTASNSNTGSVKRARVPEVKNPKSSGKKKSICESKMSTKSKRALRTKSTRKNTASVAVTTKKKGRALRAKSKKGKNYSLNNKTSRRNASSSNPNKRNKK